MPEGNSIINLSEISKPATVLIEKISEAVGGYFKPYQIKRVAKAEAEAEIIKAQAQIEITDLEHRALQRFVAEEAIKQDNIEKITQKAIPHLTDSAAPEKMENDWITNFFDKCRIVSDEEMQSLWAQAAGIMSKIWIKILRILFDDSLNVKSQKFLPLAIACVRIRGTLSNSITIRGMAGLK